MVTCAQGRRARLFANAKAGQPPTGEALLGGVAVSSFTHTGRVKVPGVPGGVYITYY